MPELVDALPSDSSDDDFMPESAVAKQRRLARMALPKLAKSSAAFRVSQSRAEQSFSRKRKMEEAQEKKLKEDLNATVERGEEKVAAAIQDARPPVDNLAVSTGLPTEMTFLVRPSVLKEALRLLPKHRGKARKNLELMLHRGAAVDGKEADLIRILDKYVPPAGGFFGQARSYVSIPSLQSLESDVRSWLMKQEKWDDADISNAFPVILAIVLCNLGIDCPLLFGYVKDRDATLNQLQRELKVDRKTAKCLVLCVLFGGSYTKVLFKGRQVAQHEWLSKLKAQLKQASVSLSKTAKYEPLYTRAQECAQARKHEFEKRIQDAKDSHIKSVRFEEQRLEKELKRAERQRSRPSTAHGAAARTRAEKIFEADLKSLQAQLKGDGQAWSSDGRQFTSGKSTNALAIFTSWVCQHEEAQAMASFLRHLPTRAQELGLADVAAISQQFDGALLRGLDGATKEQKEELLQSIGRNVVEDTGLTCNLGRLGPLTLEFCFKPPGESNLRRSLPLDEYDELTGMDADRLCEFKARYCYYKENVNPDGLRKSDFLQPGLSDWYIKARCNTGKSFLVVRLIEHLREKYGHASFTALFVTARKALSAQVVKHFQDAELSVRPYRLVRGKLDVDGVPMSVWQVCCFGCWFFLPLPNTTHTHIYTHTSDHNERRGGFFGSL